MGRKAGSFFILCFTILDCKHIIFSGTHKHDIQKKKGTFHCKTVAKYRDQELYNIALHHRLWTPLTYSYLQGNEQMTSSIQNKKFSGWTRL